MPKPQHNVLVQRVGKRWRIRFNTIIVNVGQGNFVVRAIRNVHGGWDTEQDIQYSEAGARRVPVRAQLVWGGDGHHHWHINRVAVVTLVPLAQDGRVEAGASALVDGKVGFCFYDYLLELPIGSADRTYAARSCGKEDWTVVGMGLSPGWNDTYRMRLRGQWIHVTDVPDREVPALHGHRHRGLVPRGEQEEQPDLDRHRARTNVAGALSADDRHGPGPVLTFIGDRSLTPPKGVPRMSNAAASGGGFGGSAHRVM